MVTRVLSSLLIIIIFLSGQAKGQDSSRVTNVIDFDLQGKPITKEEIEGRMGLDNRLRMVLVSTPLSTELGYITFWPIAWWMGWAATGFSVDVEYDPCTGCPTGCTPIINEPVRVATLATGTASTTVVGGILGYHFGALLDKRFAVEEIKAARALQIGEPGKLVPTGIWYLGAGQVEYGYENLERFGLIRIAYIFPSIRLGLGINGPSNLGFHRAKRTNEFQLFNFPFRSVLGMSVYIMPFYSPKKIAGCHFLNASYIYGSIFNWNVNEENVGNGYDVGLGLTGGPLVALKAGLLIIPEEINARDYRPYLSLEAALGSWFYNVKYKKIK
ncbi:MAG: hypothetical protein ABIL05_03755 [candidate division WOR-3 bacterium]